MEDFINLNNIIHEGKRINWAKSVNCYINGCYKGIEYEFKIEKYKSEGSYGYIYITINNISDWIRTNYVKNNSFGHFIKLPIYYKFEIGDIIKEDKRDLTIMNKYISKYKWNNHVYNKKTYDCHCNICGYDSMGIEESNLVKKAMCKCCRGIILVEGINDVATVYPDSIKYFQGGYEEAKKFKRGSNKKIYPVCPICGRVSTKQHTVNNIARKGFSCICRDGFSYPEKYLYNILEQLNINFIYQASKSNTCWITNNYKYDFYIPNKKIIIEIDGAQHKNVNAWGKTVTEVQFNDKNKEDFAKNNGMNIIRISADVSSNEYIMNSIKKSKLNQYFDISNIDYNKANTFALYKSIIVEVCNDRKKLKLTNAELSKKYGVCAGTITSYLKKGEKIGIIDKYIPHQYAKSSDYQKYIAKIKNSKTVYQFTLNGDYVREYMNAEEAAKSVNGIAGNIRSICQQKNDNKSYKGYLWRYDNKCNPYKKRESHNCRKVNQYTLSGKYLNTYTSINNAAKETNCNASGIQQACSG